MLCVLNPRQSLCSSSRKSNLFSESFAEVMIFWVITLYTYNCNLWGYLRTNSAKVTRKSGESEGAFWRGWPRKPYKCNSIFTKQATVSPENGFCDASGMSTRLSWSNLYMIIWTMAKDRHEIRKSFAKVKSYCAKNGRFQMNNFWSSTIWYIYIWYILYIIYILYILYYIYIYYIIYILLYI